MDTLFRPDVLTVSPILLGPVLVILRAAEDALHASGETALADDVYALALALASRHA